MTTSAPKPVSDSHTGAGGDGALNFAQAVQSTANPGMSRMPASTMPTRARAANDQRNASRMSKLTDASSRKSMLSANSETEPIALATENSTPK